VLEVLHEEPLLIQELLKMTGHKKKTIMIF